MEKIFIYICKKFLMKMFLDGIEYVDYVIHYVIRKQCFKIKGRKTIKKEEKRIGNVLVFLYCFLIAFILKKGIKYMIC